MNPALVTGRFSCQAADHDHDKGGQKQEGEQSLTARLAAGYQRSQEDARRQVRSGDEKQGQLEVPGAREIIRQQLGQVESEETACLGMIMSRCSSQERLYEEQRGDHGEIPGRGPLRRRQDHFARWMKTEPTLLGPMP